MVSGSESWVVAYPEYVVVSGTNRYHIRYRVPVGKNYRTVDDGRCGADGNWKAVRVIPEGIDDGQLCEFCWPKED